MIKNSATYTIVSHAILFLAIILSVAVIASADTNVTLGKPVNLSGEFGILRSASGWNPAEPLGSASTINDGYFLPEQTLWNSGSIWWDAQAQDATGNLISANNSIVIDLQGAYHITGIITQADNNDNYQIDYLDLTNTWIALASWNPVAGWGLMTRPNGDQVTQYPISFDALQIRLSAFGGDNFYAYSEFQAFGTPVPEPATMLLLGIGLMGLVGIRKKINK